MTIYFHNFINQAYAAASYVRDTARTHPTATKVAVIGVAILSSYAFAKYINTEIPTPPIPVKPENISPPIQQSQPPQTLLGKIQKSMSDWPSYISAVGNKLYKRATSYEENKRMILEMIQEKVIKKIFLS